MATIPVDVRVLQRAVQIYITQAYAGQTLPAPVQEREARVMALDVADPVSTDLFEPGSAPGAEAYELRLGQPMYPHMKMIIENRPAGPGVIFRADAHDTHLHAPPDSADAPLLAKLRVSNQQMVEKIEAAWVAAGVPTFRDYLRQELADRRARR